MDTDMLILRPIDFFMENKAFLGFQDEKWVNFAIGGSIPAHPLLLEVLARYEATSFNAYNPVVIPCVVTEILQKRGLQKMNMRQKIFGADLYPSEVFYPWPYQMRKRYHNYRSFIRPESYAVHLWNASWFNTGPYFFRIKKWLPSILPDKMKRFIKTCLSRE